MEYWDLYDEKRRPLCQNHLRGTPVPKGSYHLVSDIWVVRPDGKILLTQRHPDKPFGLLWECTGGSVLTGETSLQGAVRELREETGLRAQEEELRLLDSVRLEDRFVDTWLLRRMFDLDDLVLQPEEVVGAKLVSLEECDALWQMGEVVPRERYVRYREKIRAGLEENDDGCR